MKIKSLKVLLLLFAFAGFFIQCGNNELEGKWQGYDMNNPSGDIIVTITGNNFDFKSTDLEEFHKGVLKLDNTVNPKQIDFTFSETNYSDFIGKTGLGIYKIGKNTLTISTTEPGNPTRSNSFDNTEDNRVFIFTKVKE